MSAPERIAPAQEDPPGEASASSGPPHFRGAAVRALIAERVSSVEVLAALLILLIILRDPVAGMLSAPSLATWTTVFVSVMVQAVPFLVFGVLLSAVIAVFVPRSFWARALPKHPALAVPVASAAGIVLPGCECGAVPIAGP